MRLLLLVCSIVAVAAMPAVSEIIIPPSKPTNAVVTVLSDGLSEALSPGTQVLQELSLFFDKESEIRLVPLTAYGGVGNVRDLLLLRGTDLAILNSDILAYLDLASAIPEARRKLRVVAPLFYQSVLILARQEVKSLADLRGRKILTLSKQPSRGVTAKTVFGLLKIDAQFVEASNQDLEKAGTSFDAILIYDSDLPRLAALGVRPALFHALPLADSKLLSPAYLPKKIPGDYPSEFGIAGLETVQVATLLTSFDWSAKQSRYTDVSGFIERFFSLAASFRKQYPSSLLSKTDIRMDVPGWKRFAAAETFAAAAPPLMPAPQPEVPPSTANIALAVLDRPPLTNRNSKGGGVALKLLTETLKIAGISTSLKWVASGRELLEAVVSKQTADLGFFWQTPHCDVPDNQSEMEAELCDRADLSGPLMQTVVAVFTRMDTPLNEKGQPGALEQSICLPEGQTISAGELDTIGWLKGSNVRRLRRKSLIECIAAVDTREADGFVAIEPEARSALDKLMLSDHFQISDRLSATSGLYAIVAKENPNKEGILRTIDGAILKYKASGGYLATISEHFVDLTGFDAREH